MYAVVQMKSCQFWGGAFLWDFSEIAEVVLSAENGFIRKKYMSNLELSL